MHAKAWTQQRLLHDLCTTFPPQPDHEIHRDHHLETFERVFSGPVDLLVLEGDEGIGKTTLLSQFAKRYPNRTISSFVTPMRYYAYDTKTLWRDYSAQILSIVNPRKSFLSEDGGDGVLQGLIQKLKRRHGKATYYFLLDGLTDIADPIMRREVTNLLPIGHGFPVIVSGEARLLPPELRDSPRTKTTQAVNFSLAEVQQYFANLGLSDANIRQIYQECGRGIPANLASIRRSLLAGVDFDRLIGRGIIDLFEQEWRHAVNDELAERIVAVVAHSRHRLAVHSLSEVLGGSDECVSARIDRIPFLQLDPDASYVSFVSRAFADFASEKLSETKATVIDVLVKHLLERGTDEDPEAVDSLPGYLQESGRLDEVISFLSRDYFSSVLERSESFTPLRKQLQVGIDAAAQLRRDGELVRFGLESSAIREIETAQVSRYEVEALVTTDQVSEALSLAANCPLREDRLHLLGVIARCEKERGTPISEEILGQIRLLHGQIDVKSLGDKAIDIAADLFPCFPDLAISLIEQSSWADGDENELDIAYVRLSIATTVVRQTTQRSDQDDLETIRNRIRNPRLRGFTSVLSGRVQSAAEVVAETERLEKASDKLYILRTWVIEHSTREDAVDVAEYGLKTVVEATGYAPNARVLRELSTPLLHVKDPERARSLVRTFDGQRTAVDDQGPTEEVVRLQLNLAVAESLYDEEACANRLVEVYLSVDELTDLSTKSSCLARLLSALQVIDSSGRIEDKEHLTSLSTEELDTAISDLLAHTAEQVDVTRRIIDALASLDIGRSIALAENLNTAVRREEALLLAVDAILESDSDRIDLKRLRKACKNLRKRESRDHVATAVAEYLARRGSSGQEAIVESGFQVFQDLFFSVSDPIERCRVLCLLYVLAEKELYTASEAVRLDLSKRIEEALADVEPGWGRIDAGFRVARSFADRRPTQAKRYLDDAEAERRRTALSSFSSEWTYQACLRLSIRAFAGQLGHGYDPEDDMSRLGRLIDRLPSASLQAQLWGELAMHLFLQQHSDDGDRVVSESVIPLLDSIPSPVKASTILAVSPALYRNHKTTALQLFDTIEGYQRDRALMTCAEFILEQHIPSDPYEAHENGYKITYQDAIDIAELASKISRDDLVYVLIVALAETLVSSSQSSKRFSQQQRAELVRWIENLIDGKFPDQDNIQHDGYAIASKAQLLRIERGSSQSWRDLIENARSIPNKSDRAYVLAIIGQVLPAREANRREAVFKEAMDATETIPCTYDRLARLNDLARIMAGRCPHLARKCLYDTIAGFQVAEDDADAHVFRDIIDTAFKIDADFAASLVSLADDDPARAMARHEMKRRLETQSAKKAIIDGLESWDEFESRDPYLPRSAWLALGSLNAGRAHTASSIDQLRRALRAAGQFALHDGFPIIAWVIENAVRRFSGTSQSRSTIRVIFEGAMHATELVEIAGASASITVRRGPLAESTPTSEESMVIKGGEKDRAVEFLRQWLQQTALGHLYICDQYFGPTELDLLMLIQSVVPDIEVAVLTSRHCQQQQQIKSLYEAYRTGWQNISDQNPPKAEIVVVGLEGSEKSPIHDRSILTEQSGISLGTSWNSIGSSQDSTIRVMSEREASDLSERVSQFLVERRREYRGERLHYETVTL